MLNPGEFTILTFEEATKLREFFRTISRAKRPSQTQMSQWFVEFGIYSLCDDLDKLISDHQQVDRLRYFDPDERRD